MFLEKDQLAVLDTNHQEIHLDLMKKTITHYFRANQSDSVDTEAPDQSSSGVTQQFAEKINKTVCRQTHSQFTSSSQINTHKTSCATYPTCS